MMGSSPETQKDKLAIKFSSADKTFYIELSSQWVQKAGVLPKNMRAALIKQLDALKKSGRFFGYEVYFERLDQAWNRLLNSVKKNDHLIRLRLAQGYPDLSKVIRIKRSIDKNSICRVSLVSNTEGLTVYEVVCYINHKLKAAKIKGKVRSAQVMAMLERSKVGITQLDIPLMPEVDSSTGEFTKPIQFSMNVVRSEIYLAINSPEILASLNRDKIASNLEKSIKLLNEKHPQKIVEVTNLDQKLVRIKDSERMLGLSLPMLLLVAYGDDVSRLEQKIDAAKESAQNSSKQEMAKNNIQVIKGNESSADAQAEAGPEKSPPSANPNSLSVADGPKVATSEMKGSTQGQAGSDQPKSSAENDAEGSSDQENSMDDSDGKVFVFEFTDDRMVATIKNFDAENYEKYSYDELKNLLKQAVLGNNLAKKAYKIHIPKILEKIKGRKDIVGETVAEGVSAKEATGPYLYESYQDLKKQKISDDEKIDFRDLHQTGIVEEGVLIAEVRYENKRVMGEDIFGNVIDPPEAKELKIVLGEGVEEREVQKYYSSYYGVPEIKGNKIAVHKQYIHKGDVNMKSGNVIFDGPVEIHGNIDQGATVQATGDIKIIGNVEAAHVRSLEGNVVVEGGIITTERGRVEAKVDVVATFIENSQIVAGNKLVVQKVLLNSSSYVGDTIELAKRGGGMIAGGKAYAGKRIDCPNLGFENGHKTFVSCGGDWKTEYSIGINSDRIDRFEAILKTERAELRDIIGRKLRDKESPERKDAIQERIKRLRPIIEKLSERVSSLKQKKTYNYDAEIYVWDSLFVNNDIEISGKKVHTDLPLREVVIIPKLRNNTYIQGINEYLAFKKSQKDQLG